MIQATRRAWFATPLAMPALAQAPWPRRPITFIAPAAPGGATDILARVMGQSMSATLGQPVVMENRGGAAGTIATEAMAAA